MGIIPGETSGNYSYHAETSLIISNDEALLQGAREDKPSTLYSTLEPCLMCLGVATMNKVSRVIYIETDPHAGACGIDWGSLDQEVRPEIIHAPYSIEPREMIIDFLHTQIANGVRTEWSRRFLDLLGNTD